MYNSGDNGHFKMKKKIKSKWCLACTLANCLIQNWAIWIFKYPCFYLYAGNKISDQKVLSRNQEMLIKPALPVTSVWADGCSLKSHPTPTCHTELPQGPWGWHPPRSGAACLLPMQHQHCASPSWCSCVGQGWAEQYSGRGARSFHGGTTSSTQQPPWVKFTQLNITILQWMAMTGGGQKNLLHSPM